MPRTRPAYPEEFRRGVSEQTLRNRRRQAQLDRGERYGGLTSDEREELRRENVRLTQERDLLKRAAAFFARRPRPGDGLPNHLEPGATLRVQLHLDRRPTPIAAHQAETRRMARAVVAFRAHAGQVAARAPMAGRLTAAIVGTYSAHNALDAVNVLRSQLA